MSLLSEPLATLAEAITCLQAALPGYTGDDRVDIKERCGRKAAINGGSLPTLYGPSCP
jgi:hypothetical protein